jgi:hypothetical protein
MCGRDGRTTRTTIVLTTKNRAALARRPVEMAAVAVIVMTARN